MIDFEKYFLGGCTSSRGEAGPRGAVNEIVCASALPASFISYFANYIQIQSPRLIQLKVQKKYYDNNIAVWYVWEGQ